MVEMVEAVRTTASPAAIWTICVVALGCLIFWLGAIAVADKYPFWHGQPPKPPGPVLVEPLEVPAPRGGEAGLAAAGTAAAGTEGQPVPTQRSGRADRAARTGSGADPADRS
jgi:hypothetical protein